MIVLSVYIGVPKVDSVERMLTIHFGKIGSLANPLSNPHTCSYIQNSRFKKQWMTILLSTTPSLGYSIGKYQFPHKEIRIF